MRPKLTVRKCHPSMRVGFRISSLPDQAATLRSSPADERPATTTLERMAAGGRTATGASATGEGS